MIRGYCVSINKAPYCVHVLNNTNLIDIFLTGSRYFGNPSKSSDWDFYTDELNDEQKLFLEELGFEKDNKDLSELFGGVKEVFHHPDDVHVLVVSQVKWRTQVQETVREFFPNGYTDKRNYASGIWSMAVKIVELENDIKWQTRK
jgi:hypothetical protein